MLFPPTLGRVRRSKFLISAHVNCGSRACQLSNKSEHSEETGSVEREFGETESVEREFGVKERDDTNSAGQQNNRERHRAELMKTTVRSSYISRQSAGSGSGQGEREYDSTTQSNAGSK